MWKNNGHILTWILVVFSIMISYFIYDEVISIPLIITLGGSCVLLGTKFYGFYREEFFIYLFIIYIVIVGYCNIESFRISTLLYSMAYLFTFVFYTRLVKEQGFGMSHYIKIIRFLIYAYVLILIIQQLCVVLNIPIVNVSNYWSSQPYKLNSLALEPEHGSRIVSILLFSYIKIQELVLNRKYSIDDTTSKDRWLWLGCTYFFLTNGSVLAYIAFGLILFYFLKLQTFVWIMPLFASAVFIIFYFSNDYFVFKRLVLLADSFFSFNANTIIKSDASAAARIVPWFWYFQDINLFSIDTWFGHGIDYSDKLYSSNYLGTTKVASGFVGGFFPGYIQDMGIFALILFIPILKRYCLTKWWSMELLVWIILINTAPINTYLFWFGMMMFFTNKYFFDKQIKDSDENSICTLTSN